MSFEMSCANCDGRMVVEALGIVVACPHCGTHLSIPEEIPGLTDAESGSHVFHHDENGPVGGAAQGNSTWVPTIHVDDSPSSFPDFSGDTGAAIDGGSNVIVSEPDIATGSSSSMPASVSGSNVIVSEPDIAAGSEVPSAIRVENPDPSSVIPAIVTDISIPEPASGFPVLDGPDPEETATEDPEAQEQPVVQETALPVKVESDSVGRFPDLSRAADSEDAGTMPVPAAPAKTVKAAAEVPADQPPSPRPESVYDSVYSRRGKTIPNPVFQVWLSYTILLTAGLMLAIYYIVNATTSNLESLPDVKPRQNESGQVERILIPEKAAMPPGHTLALKTTQRFGNIEVTPLKVTRGDLEFTHYADASRSKPAEGPVLKLWLKFKNVSQDQTIAPLDNDLLYFRDIRGDRKAGAWANNFLCPLEEKSADGDIVLVYDHLTTGDYDLKGQNLDTPLQPGEEVTIFIPSETARLDQLSGALIWRVHFRKGYSPQNYGVTTVFEVEFSSDAIQSESSRA